MEVYRVVLEKYGDDLSGYGSFLYGGRWNHEGVYALYSASSRALAILEFLVHLTPEIATKNDYVLLTLSLPNAPITLNIEKEILESKFQSAALGTSMIEKNEDLSFIVPNIIVPEETNVIINPKHSDAGKIHITHSRPLQLDLRFTK